MSKTENINIRLEADLKKKFAHWCIDQGLKMSTAFRQAIQAWVKGETYPPERTQDERSE